MTDERHEAEIVFVDKASAVAAKIAQSLNNLGSVSGKSQAELEKLDRTIPKMASGLSKASGDLKTFSTAFRGLGGKTSAEVVKAMAAVSQLSSFKPRTASGGFATWGDISQWSDKSVATLMSSVRGLNSALSQVNAMTDQSTGRMVANTSAVTANTAARTAATNGIKTGIGATASAMQAQLGLNAASGASIGLNSQAAQAARLKADSERAAAAASQHHAEVSNSVRYALYDVATTLTAVGGAMLAVSAITFKTSIDWERNFANVVRVTGVAGNSLTRLRDEFLDLQSTLPATSSSL